MRFTGIRVLSVLALGAAVACDQHQNEGEGEGEATGTVDAELRDSAGILPYPIKVGANNAPILNNNKVQTNWNGSAADLLAADAWATCTQGVAVDVEKNDPYIAYLGNLIKTTTNACTVGVSSCPTNGTSCNVGARWRDVRKTASCNGYKGTGLTGALAPLPHNRAAYNLGAASTDHPLRAAQTELDVAEVNLCVAQKLRDDMVSAPGLLLDAADHLEVLAHVRERAQLSMLQYTALAGVLRGYVPSTTPQNPTDVGPAWGAWASKSASAAAMLAIGADAAAAIQLHVDASRELGGLLRQYTSSKSVAGGHGWGLGSWRQRLTHLVYGGDPLGNYGAGKRWQVYGGSPHTPLGPWQHVTEGDESPQAQTLLGLARKADALYFFAQPSTTTQPDPEVSAARLFQVVETSLRVPSCTVPPPDHGCDDSPDACRLNSGGGLPTCQLLVPQQQGLPTINNPQGSLLLAKHGITPEHVRSLAKLIVQSMPTVKSTATTYDLGGLMSFSGAHELLQGGVVAQRLPGAPAGSWYRLDPAFEALQSSQRGLSHGAASVDYPSTYATAAEYEPSRRFLGSTPKGNVAMRELGAVPALALARDVWAEGARDATAGNRPTKAFFQKAMKAMPFASAAIGGLSVSVRPVTVVEKTYPGGMSGWAAGDDLVIERQYTSDGTAAGEPLWSVAVVTKKTDPNRILVAVTPQTFIEQAALEPGFRSFGGKTREYYFGALSDRRTYGPTRTDDLGFDGLERRVYQVSGNARSLFLAHAGDGSLEGKLLPVASLPGPSRTETHKFINFRSIGGTPQPYIEERALRFNESGDYMAYGGSLGKLVEDVWAFKPYNWSKPAFDGLGVKLDWFPPMTDLPDIAPGQTPASYFAAKAAEAAATARGLATQLVNALMDVHGDNLAEDQARANARLAEINEQKRLCGVNPATGAPNACDTTVVDLNLIADGVVDESIFACGVLCHWYHEQRDLAFPRTMPVLKVVRDAVVGGQLDNAGAPSFSQYNGGALQRVLIDQWAALRRVRDTMREMQSFIIGAAASYDTAAQALTVAGQMVALECGDLAMKAAHEACFSYNLKKGENDNAGCYGDSTADAYCVHKANGRTFNPGPFYAQLHACDQQKLALAAEQAEAAGVLNGVFTKVYGYVVQAHQVGDDVLRQTADALRLKNEADLASSKAKFESERVGDELKTRFGAYRRFHMYDAGKARAEVERARLLALYARRALEADYVVDLSTIFAAGPLVTDPPADWADKVYEPSLDLPSLMNLSLGDGNATPAGGADWFTSYAQKLDDFRLDYVLSNYNMTVSGINQLVELPPPEKLVPAPASGGGTVNVVSDEVAAWSFYCPATQSWRQHPLVGQPLTVSALPTLCNGQPPTKAKLTFTLDPWGRLGGDVYEQGDDEELRYNMRAMQFALNLEGTGVTSCATAGCTPPSHVSYNLAQFSPAWLSDVNQDLHAFDVNAGRALNASALAMRKSVVLVQNDFDSGDLSPFLNNANVRRLELVSRPLGAAYELEFNLTNGVRIENVKNIQLLFKQSYWQ